MSEVWLRKPEEALQPRVPNSIWPPLDQHWVKTVLHCFTLFLFISYTFSFVKKNCTNSIALRQAVNMLFLCFHLQNYPYMLRVTWLRANSVNNNNRHGNPTFPTFKWNVIPVSYFRDRNTNTAVLWVSFTKTQFIKCCITSSFLSNWLHWSQSGSVFCTIMIYCVMINHNTFLCSFQISTTTPTSRQPINWNGANPSNEPSCQHLFFLFYRSLLWPLATTSHLWVAISACVGVV